jgi:hypothetical protein
MVFALAFTGISPLRLRTLVVSVSSPILGTMLNFMRSACITESVKVTRAPYDH